MAFEPVDRQLSLPALEESVLARWRERDVFARSVARRTDAPAFNLYEGPPTANGPPGLHHVPTRTFKDLYARYRTMKGYRVVCQAGWDCHGIPVEVEVERALGFTRKGDIERFGVAAFNERCRASVRAHVDDWVRLSERIGCWMDFDGAYWTMSPEYVDSVWWSLARLWDRGLLYADRRVVPYCPRCGTALSDHEVAQGLAVAESPSVYVRFPVADGPLADEGAALLVWTTTPWTLLAGVALAIGEDVDYALVDTREHGRLVLAAGLAGAVLGDGARVVRHLAPAELRGLRYHAPYEPAAGARTGDPRPVVAAGFVSGTQGTGVVHVAPAFGPDDLGVAVEHGLEVPDPLDGEGRFDARAGRWSGREVRDADAAIVDDLRARGLLVRAGTHRHEQPFCWRCGTRLLQRARPSWFVATTRVRDRLLEVNAGVRWHPEHVRDGRFGNWLAGNVDWALSRQRYWGTPLPLWRCEDCDGITAVSSRAELSRLAGRDLSGLDPHRPGVDAVTLACAACGGLARRVPDVVDAWYDSGAVPFAQIGYPHAEGSVERLPERFPAALLVEGIDQTRGWFYALLAVATLLFDRPAYREVLCLGLMVDAEGRKMSKSRGNTVDPWSLVAASGADALRWHLVADQSPWVDQRVGRDALAEVVRRFVLTLWNTYAFFVTYARIDAWTPGADAPPLAERPVLDRWVLAELAETVASVDAALDAFDARAGAQRLERFVDDLSNWYVRRSRRRFWASGDSRDKRAAFATLYTCLTGLSRLLAPLAPFLADELHENLVRRVDPAAPDSVHLTDFPVPDPGAADPALGAAMAAARRVTELGRRARNEAGVALRQPLRAAVVLLPAAERGRWEDVAEIVADELNVKRLTVARGARDLVAARLEPDFRALGPAFGARAPAVAAALAAAGEAGVAALRSAGRIVVPVEGEEVTVTSAQVRVVEEPPPGWHAATGGPYGIAIDVTLDEGLRAERLARELARAVNDVRRRQGVAVDERVRLELDPDPAVAAALDAHEAWVAGEVLAVEVRRGPLAGGQDVELPGGARTRVRLEPTSRQHRSLEG